MTLSNIVLSVLKATNKSSHTIQTIEECDHLVKFTQNCFALGISYTMPLTKTKNQKKYQPIFLRDFIFLLKGRFDIFLYGWKSIGLGMSTLNIFRIIKAI